MKNLHFDYEFIIGYSFDVCKCNYTIKCLPKNTARQKIRNVEIEMIPESKPEYGYDSLGNKYIWGCNEVPHKIFKFRIVGEATCGYESYEEIANSKEKMIYRHGTQLTEAGPSLLEYYASLKEKLGLDTIPSNRKKAIAIMNQLHADFTYEQGVTHVFTTAEEAFSLRKGVCQDYSHILVTLLRLEGCSARYVTGFMIGEGATHAWIEVVDEDRWYGLDPTNNIEVFDSHIKIGVGRDASECQINRGIMHGGGEQTLDSRLTVTDTGFGSNFIKKGLL